MDTERLARHRSDPGGEETETSPVDLIVGCPVSHRQWILDDWFDHIFAACTEAGIDRPMFAFVGDCERDRSFEVIDRRAKNRAVLHQPNPRSGDRRDWGVAGRYQQMVIIRNCLLGLVRLMRPALFLSIDSDILLNPRALTPLIDDLDDGYDAMGGKCFMTETGTSCPSWAQVGHQGGLIRYDADGVFPVEVIMAIKLMTPSAYDVDYELHIQGEDTGWSLAARRHGLKLGWDGRIASKHVMSPHLLKLTDPRVGY